MFRFFILLLGFTMAGMASTTILKNLQWEHRVIVVFAESAKADSLANQFEQEKEALDERHIRWFVIMPDSQISNGEPLAEKDVRSLKEQGASVLLIGKDGGIKHRAPELDFGDIYRRIDAMPMRRSEMRRQNEERE